MAYVYLKGVGIEMNIKKRKQYLEKLSNGLKLKFNDDISNLEEPDKIIKDYYFSN